MKQFILFITAVCIFAACGNNNNNYDASGVFEATEIMVSAQGNGQLMKFDVEEGKQVQEGEQLGFIDTVQLYLRKEQLQESVKAVNTRRPDISTQIAATEQQIIIAKNEQKRFENLVKANAANQKQLDDIKAQVLVLEKQLAAQKSSLEKASKGTSEESSAMGIQIAQIEDQLEKCRILSPANGTVLAKYAEQGELASIGKPLFKVADLETVFLRAYFTSDQLSQMKLGQKVTAFADFGKKKKEYAGTLVWISDKSEFTPKTIQTKDERANLVYAVKIAVKNDGYLKIGMYGEVKLTEN